MNLKIKTNPSIINIELTSYCNKKCWMCGRRKREKDSNYKIEYGNIDFNLLKKISKEIPTGALIQFHNNGEPLMYPRIKEALELFEGHIRCFDTNGKLLLEKQKDIIGSLETITISTFEKDPEWKKQYDILCKFLEDKKDKAPNIIIRLLGDISDERVKLYNDLNCLVAKRILHSPDGSFNYKKETVVPETGICLEMLGHPAINIKGELSICVRFDPERKGVLGSLKENTFDELWNSDLRKKWMSQHILGQREEIPLCSKCDFWGIPRG